MSTENSEAGQAAEEWTVPSESVRPPLDLAAAQRQVAAIYRTKDHPIDVRMLKKHASAITLAGPVATLWPEIEAAQRDGYQVYIRPNPGGWSDDEISECVALFIDGDDMPLPEKWHVEPSFIVQRSPVRWQVWWLLDKPLTPAEGRVAALRLASYYGTDRLVANPATLARLAGTLNLKGEPVAYTITKLSGARQAATGLLAGLPDVIVREKGTAKRDELAAGFTAGLLDAPHTIQRAAMYLDGLEPVREGDRADRRTFEVACGLREMGLTEEAARDLLKTRYKLEPQDDRFDDFIDRKVDNAYTYAQNSIGLWYCPDLHARFADYLKTAAREALKTKPEPPEAPPFFDLFTQPERTQFPLDALPADLASYAGAIARSRGSDLSSTAMVMLGAIAGALDQQFTLDVTGAGWLVRPRLWILISGDTGSGKGPLINGVIEPLQELNSSRWGAYYGRLDDHEKKRIPEKPDEPEVLYQIDVTSEYAIRLLEKQPRGFIMVQHEWSKFVGGMDRYKSGGTGGTDRGAWIEIYDGQPRPSGRVGTGGRHMQGTSVGFLAAVQPEVLKKLGDQTSIGFLQRFLPVQLGDAAFVRKIAADDLEILHRYKVALRRVVGLVGSKLHATPEALEIIADAREELHAIRGNRAYSGQFREFVSKLPGIIGSLAMVLHLAQPEKSAATMIGVETAAAAVRVMKEYILPEAFSFYSWTLDARLTDLQLTLARFVLCGDAATYVPSDFTNGPLRRLNYGARSRELHEFIQFLVNLGWLTEERKPGWPHPVAYHVEPQLRTTLAGVRERESHVLAARREAFHSEILPVLRAHKAKKADEAAA